MPPNSVPLVTPATERAPEPTVGAASLVSSSGWAAAIRRAVQYSAASRASRPDPAPGTGGASGAGDAAGAEGAEGEGAGVAPADGVGDGDPAHAACPEPPSTAAHTAATTTRRL
ncbi:hypothetical protein GCM10010510_36740 [Streptomyces anandii JCM 4720]|nr:hypothetical protein GCM10010510_36740 [Streptomyces anandii JCM 4720]